MYSRLFSLPPFFMEFPVMVRPSAGVLIAVVFFANLAIPSDGVSAADPLHVQLRRVRQRQVARRTKLVADLPQGGV